MDPTCKVHLDLGYHRNERIFRRTDGPPFVVVRMNEFECLVTEALHGIPLYSQPKWRGRLQVGWLGKANDVKDDSDGSGCRGVEQSMVVFNSQAVLATPGVETEEVLGRCIKLLD